MQENLLSLVDRQYCKAGRVARTRAKERVDGCDFRDPGNTLVFIRRVRTNSI